MQSASIEQLEIGGRVFSIAAWDGCARTTFNPANATAGEWHLNLTGVLTFTAGAAANSDYGAIEFASDGVASLHFRDNLGSSPFVLVQLIGFLAGLPLVVRYSTSLTEGEQTWTDWCQMTWGAVQKGYVHVGPTCDGSIGQAGMWGFVEIRMSDDSSWSLMKVRAGWAALAA